MIVLGTRAEGGEGLDTGYCHARVGDNAETPRSPTAIPVAQPYALTPEEAPHPNALSDTPCGQERAPKAHENQQGRRKGKESCKATDVCSPYMHITLKTQGPGCFAQRGTATALPAR